MKFNFRVSPNYRAPLSTQRIMFELTMAILVVLAYSVYFYFAHLGADYGIHALAMIVTAVVVAVGTEMVWAIAFKKNPVKYVLNSFPWVTALLFVGMMGINKPLYVVIVGSVVAILIGKLLFGGFGFNIFNPAGVGRVFVVLSFGGLVYSGFPDVVTGATPNTVMETLGWVIKDPAAVSTYLEQFGGLWGLATGGYVGALGETNTLLIFAVGVYLAVRGIIDWKAPAAFLVSLFVFAGVIALWHGMGIWYPVYHLLTGGVMFGAIFMLTDPVTSPTSITGRLIFAIGIAFLVVLMRVKANLPEGMIRSILFMNMLSPMLDQLTDGQSYVNLKKNIAKVAGVFTASVAIVFVFATMIDYIEPKAESASEHEIVVVLGHSVLVSDYNTGSSEIVSRTENGHLITFVVNAPGYEVLESEYAEDPKPNQFEIVVDTDTHSIVSAAYVAFNDTYKVGDKTDAAIFFDQFAGYDINSTDGTIDVVTGATFSSESAVRALATVIAAMGQ